ncbi:hypothetical protein [Flagellimonas beolgyonensis]|uniref:hypothetical protein n=1 Tax=Flagellimonas beolgyonensis TaxID=864064 RepID=UPI003D64FBDA
MKRINLPMLSFLLILLCASPVTIAQNVKDFKIKMLGPANLNFRKSPKRIVISDFQVNFQTALQLEDKKKGGKMWRGGLKGDAKASLTLVLDGLNIEDLQQLTDKLFEEYKADLAAKGFEIAPIEELWNHSAYEKNREQRWDLRSGQGGEKGDKFGDIVMRPTGQKFIVAKQNMENKKAGPLKLANYEEQVEMKVANQKNDFIFNKVVLNVISFDNALSETTRALNRHAGYAQVKAETDFKIDESSFNRFNIGQVVSNHGVEVEGVLEKQKFDASQGADVDKRGTDAGVFRIWRVEDKEDINVSVVKCDSEKYKRGAEMAIESFLDATIQKLVDKAN